MQTGAHRGKTSRPWFHRPTIALIIAAVRIVTGMALTQLIRHYVKPPTGVTPPQNWLASLTRWDANWYSNIARHGYFSLPSHAFYPGFPLLVRLLAPLAGYSGATVVLSWAATWIAIWGLLRVCDHYASAASSDAATLLFAWGPLSLFLVAGYPESLLGLPRVAPRRTHRVESVFHDTAEVGGGGHFGRGGEWHSRPRAHHWTVPCTDHSAE